MNKKLKRKELLLTDSSSVDIISLVKKPAIEMDFIKFGKTENVYVKFLDNEKKVITGPALIPDKLIYRRNEETGEEFNVFFSSNTIEKIAQQYLQDHNQSNVNLEHDDMIDDVFLFELWLVEDPTNDKSNALGFNVPKGTMMISMKVNNDEIWEKIKSGEVAGFSIEGMLAAKLTQFSTEETDPVMEQIYEILKNVE